MVTTGTRPQAHARRHNLDPSIRGTVSLFLLAWLARTSAYARLAHAAQIEPVT